MIVVPILVVAVVVRRNASISSSRCHCSIDGVAFSIGSIGHSGREK